MKTFACLSLLAICAASTQDPHAPPKSEDPHLWLHQLVGEWTAVSEASMGPGTEPIRIESTEKVRSIGGLWIQGEGSATFDGKPFTSILTLGYDVQKKTFVGSWIDSMQTHMWVYRGSLDEKRRVLTLDTEGPSFDDPSKTSRYRDAFEIVDADTRTLRSSVLGEGGEWTTFMTAEYRRKKS